MTFPKFGAFIFFLFVLAEVAPWTIDLPEVRKQLFEEHEKQKKYIKNDYKNYVNDGQEFYSNAQGNSKHNSDHINKHYDRYAKEFEHQSYMEKKVVDIVQDGGVYLDGLRRSLEDYNRFLQECNRQNMSVPLNFTTSMSDMFNISMLNTSNALLQNPNTNDGAPMMGGNNSARARMSCRQATEASERVRRYAELAIWTTRRLQDIAYAKDYQKTSYYEENELILKLAWFLDQLAVLTGYEPDYRQYINRRTTTTSTTSPAPVTLVPQTQELNNFLMGCIKANSSMPATVRCSYPLPLPPVLAGMVGGTSTPSPQPDASQVFPISQPDFVPQQSMELLMTSDNYRSPTRIRRSPDHEEYIVPIPVHEKPKPVVDFIVKKLSNLKAIVKAVKKNAVADFTHQLAYHKHLYKRSIDVDTSILLNKISNGTAVIPIINAESNDRRNKSIDKFDQSVVKLDQPIVKSDQPIVKSDQPIVKSDQTIVKSDQPIVESDQPIVKSDQPNGKSDRPNVEFDKSTNNSDKSIVQFDKSVIDIVSLKRFPVLDASIVNTKSFKKRSISDTNMSYNPIKTLKYKKSPVLGNKSVKKRSVNDPLTEFVTYYLKHKAWGNSNPSPDESNNRQTNFEVNNSLESKTKSKRSLFQKKNEHLKLNRPLQILNSDKHKHSLKNGKTKLLFYYRNILAKKHGKSLKNEHKIKKRSLKYEDMYLPRIPTNPAGDISYYVKNKEGHNYNPNLTQAAQVRLGLQQHFVTGNILVIQRYGSNYNPAVPNAAAAGFAKGSADV